MISLGQRDVERHRDQDANDRGPARLDVLAWTRRPLRLRSSLRHARPRRVRRRAPGPLRPRYRDARAPSTKPTRRVHQFDSHAVVRTPTLSPVRPSRRWCRAMTDVETQDRYIALLLRSGEPEEHAAGAVIFTEGDPADRMYVVQSGSVALSIGDRVVETVAPGGLFGEIAVIDREPRSGVRRSRDRHGARRDRQAPILVPRAGDAVLRRDRDARDGEPAPARDGTSILIRRSLLRSLRTVLGF